MKPKTVAHAELVILKWLIEGNGASLGDHAGIARIAETMSAGVDAEGEPTDEVAHRRFNTAVQSVTVQMRRLLEQRERKVGGSS
jgi:hypothetical protein